MQGVESQEDPEEALNAVIAETNSLLGLREVKEHFLDLRDSVQLHRVQGADPRQERFHIIFQGNPGTGKTTVARLYAKLLRALNVLESDTVKETSGAQLASIGPQKTREMLRSIGITNNDSDDDLTSGNIFFSSPGLRPRHSRPSGGVLFVDEAYQLTAPHVSNGGRQALDIILTDMENNIGKLVVIFAGYNEELEAFFGHNRGLKSRIPYTLHFEDFGEKELLSILQTRIRERFNGRMVVEGGLDGKYMRVAVRRLSRARGTKGFGNARAAEILLQQIHRRQARRLKTHLNPTSNLIFFFSMEDLVGPSPSHVRRHSVAWVELQKLTGLDAVKKSIEATIDSIEWNYERELEEDEPIAFSLNRVFVGSPGTGKTTVARLYGQILADLGLLSNGTVVIKKPPDFIGDAVGKLEANTKAILASTEGKVLIIDEAYMLDPGDSTRQQESYKSAVLDTLVGEVQSVPGDDRCVILLGYEDKLQAMFQNANPGLPGRFATDDPFYFDDFSPEQLRQVLREKMRKQNLHYAPEALEVATDVLNRARLRPTFSNGTGKTTAARHMGKLFYNMGLLSTDAVVEYSAADLIGQHVGHTVPKAREQLKRALGKVLLIDAAYRLMESGKTHQ
ncbi:hypothetical protein SLS56_012107 [Neofusicoccum ribis]|uniref:AAA+ ATPase domain-containing protein n=1 Tax=Neofusicoccum ribis TaxID=45134 RepID=A0ABR3SAS3_9PEZI